MVILDPHLSTDSDRRQIRISAQVLYEEALEHLSGLISQLKTVGERTRKINSLISAVRLDPDNPERSEANLLMLATGDYDGIDFDTVRNLGNSIAAARKDLREKESLAAGLGVSTWGTKSGPRR